MYFSHSQGSILFANNLSIFFIYLFHFFFLEKRDKTLNFQNFHILQKMNFFSNLCLKHYYLNSYLQCLFDLSCSINETAFQGIVSTGLLKCYSIIIPYYKKRLQTLKKLAYNLNIGVVFPFRFSLGGRCRTLKKILILDLQNCISQMNLVS